MQVKYVGPFDGVEIAVGSGFVTVPKDGTIDVPVAIAGRVPSDAYLEAVAVLAEVQTDHAARSAAIEALSKTDPGEGLLAQVGNWEPVAPVKKEKNTD